MAEPIVIDGQRAWLKQYGDSSRALTLGVLAFVSRRFHLDALRPPPHRGGDAARDVEARRLAELHSQDVNVPQVIGQGRAALVLSDNGRSLAACLGEADDAGRDALVSLAMAAIARAHRNGAYFGQPWPRNMTYDGHAIGFIDFEEDPLEVMDLEQAQARDWLMFGYGVAKYYDDRPDVLQRLMSAALGEERAPVRAHAQAVTGRLQGLARVGLRMGRSARALAHSILVIHAAVSLGVLLVAVICVDWFMDGHLDILDPFV
ncbi:serine/threonine protein phosphatase [Stenotrophomonas sp. MMGLT7]|uniref:serine/threonine protein phosphatase n=1 Tax=Stenotrophomonas sp. MMGLT7 TaxID=2901227 RepID=UPI001E533F07|nr:serine/threonine protein phosphatase [Stenotrophomonas sp. MMGLT7]MCD7097529.1 serine/threonine protein phosphatase [Stenotrophomonas sp. MMGLT7]